MVQLLGAVLVAAGCAWLGFGAAASLSRRAEGLEDMASALALLERELELGALPHGIEFFADELDKIEEIQLRTPVFTTVENYTSWLRCGGEGEAFFYLGGYATRCQRDFLRKVYASNPAAAYRHFGDIDAGGLYIHEHLCRVTGIPFQMYRMSRAELSRRMCGNKSRTRRNIQQPRFRKACA